MGQQLLLEENLSERLLPLLIERFPGSTHVRGRGRPWQRQWLGDLSGDWGEASAQPCRRSGNGTLALRLRCVAMVMDDEAEEMGCVKETLEKRQKKGRICAKIPVRA